MNYTIFYYIVILFLILLLFMILYLTYNSYIEFRNCVDNESTFCLSFTCDDKTSTCGKMSYRCIDDKQLVCSNNLQTITKITEDDISNGVCQTNDNDLL